MVNRPHELLFIEPLLVRERKPNDRQPLRVAPESRAELPVHRTGIEQEHFLGESPSAPLYEKDRVARGVAQRSVGRVDDPRDDARRRIDEDMIGRESAVNQLSRQLGRRPRRRDRAQPVHSAIDHGVETRELGVRIALGAQVRDVLQLVIGAGMRFGIIGIVVGLGITLLTGRFVAPLLFEVSPRDPVILSAVGALLLGVAVVASGIPALRATRVDPNVAVRAE